MPLKVSSFRACKNSGKIFFYLFSMYVAEDALYLQ